MVRTIWKYSGNLWTDIHSSAGYANGELGRKLGSNQIPMGLQDGANLGILAFDFWFDHCPLVFCLVGWSLRVACKSVILSVVKSVHCFSRPRRPERVDSDLMWVSSQ